MKPMIMTVLIRVRLKLTTCQDMNVFMVVGQIMMTVL